MPAALALPAIAALIQAASAGADVGIRLEARSTTITTSVPNSATDSSAGMSDVIQTRGAYSVTPTVQLRGEALHLQLTGNYLPQLWVSDLEKQRDPLQMHRADLTLRLSTSERWAVSASAYGSRGQTDPLAAFRPGASTSIPETTGFSVEDLRTSLHAEYGWNERTTLSTNGSWQISRAVVAAHRTNLPTQRSIAADVAGSLGLTERDTVQLALRGQRIQTGGMNLLKPGANPGEMITEPGGDTYTGLVGAIAAWDHRFTPAVQTHAGGGLVVAWSHGLRDPPDLLPSAETGLTWTRDSLTLDLAARLTTQADRYTGYMRPTLEGTGALQWQISERWSSTISGFAAHRTTGETTIAGGELHLAWALRTMMTVDVGVRARRQHERDPLLPSYTEAAVFTALVFQTERFIDYQGGP